MAKQLASRIKELSSLCECWDEIPWKTATRSCSSEGEEFDGSYCLLPWIDVLPPKTKIHVSTSWFVIDKNQNIMWARRVKCEERAAGWGNPGRSQVEFGDIRKVVLNNLLEDIGLEITEIVSSDGEVSYSYNDDNLSVEPWYMYESVRDINNEEYLTINFHEIILFFLIQLGVSKDKVNLQITGNLVDNVVWLTPSELRTILLKEESGNWTTGVSVKNKKHHRERIMYSQLEPFYPNNLTGEGIVKEDYYAYLYLLKKYWQSLFD